MHLALVCVGALVLTAGCVGEKVSTAPTLQVDRPTDAEEECPAVEVLEEDERFAPRLVPGLDSGKTWPIELEAGEAIEIQITWAGGYDEGRDVGLPDLRMTEPGGDLLLEKEGYGSNDHRVAVETDGVHEITAENQYLDKSGHWFVEIIWYPGIECA